jgi:hypothetical protein
MPKPLRIYNTWLVGSALLALVAASLVIRRVYPEIGLPLDGGSGSDLDLWSGILFWVVVVALTSALPVQLSGGVQVAVSTAPLMAATVLGGPLAGAIVAALGTTDARELRGKVPWYGTLVNHAAIVLPIVAAGFVLEALPVRTSGPLDALLSTLATGAPFASSSLRPKLRTFGRMS